MLSRTSMTRSAVTALAAGLMSFVLVSGPRTAQATCGDWLDHGMASRPLSDSPHSEANPWSPGSRCKGSQCGGAPLLPPPPQRSLVSIHDLSAILAALGDELALTHARRLVGSDELPLVGPRVRIERPPRQG